MNRRRILLILVQLLAFAAIAQAVTVWIFWRSPWTPLQRHYLPAYIWCSLPVISPATVEVRLIWKNGRHRKRELATDDDAVDSGEGTSMALSQSATDAGWKTLIKGPPQQVPAEILRPNLASLVFDGQSLGDFLLLPELSAIAALCISIGAWFLVIGFFRALARELAWRRRVSPWQGPSPGFFDMCRTFLDECQVLTSRACSGLAVLHRSALRRTETCRAAQCTTTCRPETAVEPPAKPASFAFPLFGVYNGTGDGYLWSEKDEIE